MQVESTRTEPAVIPRGGVWHSRSANALRFALGLTRYLVDRVRNSFTLPLTDESYVLYIRHMSDERHHTCKVPRKQFLGREDTRGGGRKWLLVIFRIVFAPLDTVGSPWFTGSCRCAAMMRRLSSTMVLRGEHTADGPYAGYSRARCTTKVQQKGPSLRHGGLRCACQWVQ